MYQMEARAIEEEWSGSGDIVACDAQPRYRMLHPGQSENEMLKVASPECK